MRTSYLKALCEVIRKLHGMPVIHVQSTFVCVDELWQGDVEVFALMGPNESWKCFAWRGRDRHAVVMLANASVHSPEDAVRNFHRADRRRSMIDQVHR